MRCESSVVLPELPATVFPWLLEVDKVPRWMTGLDVYEFDGAGAASAKSGTWMGANQAAAYFAGLPKVSVTERNALVCLLPQG